MLVSILSIFWINPPITSMQHLSLHSCIQISIITYKLLSVSYGFWGLRCLLLHTSSSRVPPLKVLVHRGSAFMVCHLYFAQVTDHRIITFRCKVLPYFWRPITRSFLPPRLAATRCCGCRFFFYFEWRRIFCVDVINAVVAENTSSQPYSTWQFTFSLT